MFIVALAQSIPLDDALIRTIVEADTLKILGLGIGVLGLALVVLSFFGGKTLFKLLNALTETTQKLTETNTKANEQIHLSREAIERMARLDEQQTGMIQHNQGLLHDTQAAIRQVQVSLRQGFTRQDEAFATLADRIIGETGSKMDEATRHMVEKLEPVVTALGEIGQVVNEAKALSVEHTQQNVTVREQVTAMGDRFEVAQRQILEAIYELVASPAPAKHPVVEEVMDNG